MTIARCIAAFPSVRVLLAGDVMLDRFIYGDVERISPEAPIPVLRVTHEKHILGGAGNVAANIVALGGNVRLIGLAGADAKGGQTRALLAAAGIEADLFAPAGFETICKTRYIAMHTQLLRADREVKYHQDATELLPELERAFSSALPMSDVVVLSDYTKGLLAPEITRTFIDDANRAGKPVLVDPKGTDWDKYCGARLIKPNLKEFGEARGVRYDSKSEGFEKTLAADARKTLERYGFDGLMITLGELGMLYVSMDGIQRVPTVAREVFDVSGAGDTSLAVMALAVGAGADMKKAVHLANAASGIVVGKLGTATVSPDELAAALVETKRTNKILTRGEVTETAARLRNEGRKIVFTNGAFDCLHCGHLASLKAARGLGDVLFVGANSDASVRRYKGPDRPIQDQETRARVLAALEMVDYVIVFDDDTALPLVQVIRPDVIAKEGYAEENWPEARWVKSHGGTAVTLPRVEGYSTSALVEKMRK
jgi:D-beta-D-heptose 7-phosphate kinase/D-beta-D-heptose 1-phosphate adenosyltransferase